MASTWAVTSSRPTWTDSHRCPLILQGIQATNIWAISVTADAFLTDKISVTDDGTVTNPSIKLGAGLDSGIFVPATDTLGFVINDLEIVRLGATSLIPVLDSNVDLGTSSLQFKDFHVDLVLADDVELSDGAAGTPSLHFQDADSGFYSTGTAEVAMTLAGSEVWRTTTARVDFDTGALKFLKLPVKTDTGDPTGGSNGDMYVNVQDNSLRLFADAAWRDVVTW